MKKRMIEAASIALMLLVMIFGAVTMKNIEKPVEETKVEIACIDMVPELLPQEVLKPIPVVVDVVKEPVQVEKLKRTVPAEEQIIEGIDIQEEEPEEVVEEKLAPWTSEEIELANLVEAEAGNQGLRGKQLVADVVLNRVDSDRFPDTIHEVIFQENQFTVTVNGQFSYWGSRISEESLIAARTELAGPRIDYGILYFNSGSRSANGSGAWKYKDHWFAY